VVANNEPTALIDAYALIKILATRHGETRFKLLMNNLSHPREGEAAFRTLLKVTSRFLGLDVVLEYLGYIPCDPAISQAVMRQQAVLTLYPEAPASQSFIRLAQRLRDDPPPPEVAGNIKLFWRRMLQCQT
jgi:flagellar biosynthesis protein FlhG